jgi:predicted O-methyltransferase YrrM
MSFLLSWLRCLPRRNCRIRYQSLWNVDLAEYDVVYCFLSPAPMPELWKKAQAELRPGALLISNTFEIPGVPPSQVIELNDWRQSKILIWQR